MRARTCATSPAPRRTRSPSAPETTLVDRAAAVCARGRSLPRRARRLARRAPALRGPDPTAEALERAHAGVGTGVAADPARSGLAGAGRATRAGRPPRDTAPAGDLLRGV